MTPETVERALDRLTAGDGLPPRERLPGYVAPLPAWLENVGLSLAPLVVATNLVGTAFGFWYYRFQFAGAPPAVWPLVPDSPLATLFAALAFGLWWLDRGNDYVAALAFLGCWKLGLWTPFVLAVFADAFLAVNSAPMYAFLFCSHLAMVVQAFVLHRVADFRPSAVAVAAAWYGLNDVVDYAVPVVGTPHHTLLPAQTLGPVGYTHPSPTHEIAAAGAVALTLSGTALALATRAAKRRAGEQ
ncbi:MAG: DUF1405 domain-containing protein [Haloferacaceae archaeon]